MGKFVLIVLLILSFQVFSQDIVIIHTNDLHSHLNGLSPETEYTPLVKDMDPTLGGMARIAGYIDNQKELFGDKLLVVDAGDFLMGTLFQTIELNEGFQLNLMHKMGYEFATLGNHEFDFGPDSLAKIIRNSMANGPIPQLIFSNYKTSKIASDADFVKLFEDNIILPYSINEKNGYRIGIFSLMGVDADESISSNQGLQFENQKKVARKTARFLKKKEKVDLVVVLSHCGVAMNKKGKWQGEDVELAKSVHDIDLIISGHSHTMLPEAIKAGNALIVQTGHMGLNVGKVEISFDSYRKPVFQYQLIEMNDNITANAEIQNLIDSKVPQIENEILADLGLHYQTIVAETSFNLELDEFHPFESNLGPFVANAIHYQLNQNHQIGVDVVLVASGIIRYNIYKGNTGMQNINDVFNVMPLGFGGDKIPGFPLGKVYINGGELKKLMELILTVYSIKPTHFLHFSGMEVECDMSKGIFRKISRIRIGDDLNGYKTIDISKKSSQQVSIASNTFLLSFIGQLKKMSFGLVNIIPKNSEGISIENNNYLIDLDPNTEGIQEAKEWIAIYDYMKSFKDINGNGIPDIPRIYEQKRNALIMLNQ
ncbi:MAG TPA: bifunctional metallophosphatase/5'-nucleotidase [Prolixibacteraceae bacterium]|nr:bifunctional metallophosphatase/5'-nucleotidase [Prolixibacteraceae bacterium]